MLLFTYNVSIFIMLSIKNLASLRPSVRFCTEKSLKSHRGKVVELNYVKPLSSIIFINYICNQNLSLNINLITKQLYQ